MKKTILAISLTLFGLTAFAKLPPAPPVDPKVAEEKAAKDKATAEKGKAEQAAAEDRTVKNFQANMKKAGKPIPKPTPIVVAAAPAPAAAAAKAPEKAAKDDKSKAKK
jgi:hypothetical protein